MQVVIITGVHPDENEYSCYVSTWLERVLLEDLAVSNELSIAKLSLYPYAPPSKNRLYSHRGLYFDLNRVFTTQIWPCKDELSKAVALLDSYYAAPNGMARFFIDSCVSLGIDTRSITFGVQSEYNGFFGFSNSQIRSVCSHEVRRVGDIVLARLLQQKHLVIVDMHAGMGRSGEISLVYHRNHPLHNSSGYFCEELQHYIYNQKRVGSSLYVLEVGIEGTERHFSKVLYELCLTRKFLGREAQKTPIENQKSLVRPSYLTDEQQIQESIDRAWLSTFEANEIVNLDVVKRLFMNLLDR